MEEAVSLGLAWIDVPERRAFYWEPQDGAFTYAPAHEPWANNVTNRWRLVRGPAFAALLGCGGRRV